MFRHSLAIALLSSAIMAACGDASSESTPTAPSLPAIPVPLMPYEARELGEEDPLVVDDEGHFDVRHCLTPGLRRA